MIGKRQLGLAMEDRRITVTDVTSSGRRRSIHCAAVFEFPDGLTLDKPDQVGKELALFLRKQGIKTRHAVVGLPAIWLMSKRHAVPPVQGEALANLLRISAERVFATEGKDLAVDFVPDDSAGKERQILLIATLKKRLTQVSIMAQSAGLQVTAVAPSMAALGVGGDTGSGLTLQLTPGAAELSVRSNGRLSSIQHVPMPHEKDLPPGAKIIDNLGRELRRLLATGMGDIDLGDRPGLTIWDGLGLAANAAEPLADRLSVGKVRSGRLDELAELNGSATQGADAGRFAASIALALGGTERGLLAVDFLHSRLAPVRKRRFDPRWRWPIIAALVVISGLGYLFYDNFQQSQEIAGLRKQTAAHAAPAKAARQFVDKVIYADGWYANKPHVLECLRELSLCFPENSNIWATNFTLREDMQGLLSGRARDDKDVLHLIDEMKAVDKAARKPVHPFINIKLQYMREGGKDSKDLNFAIVFTFTNKAAN